MEPWRPSINKEKYEQAILYLLNSPANNALLGKVKLFKLLYYIDFDHYQEFREPITGDVYRKLPFGPVPDNANGMLSQMVSSELIQISSREIGEYRQFIFTPLEPPPDLTKTFTSTEIAVLQGVIEKWANRSTNDIVAATHSEAPWRAANMGEEIPYALAFYRRGADEELTNYYEDLEEMAVAG